MSEEMSEEWTSSPPDYAAEYLLHGEIPPGTPPGSPPRGIEPPPGPPDSGAVAPNSADLPANRAEEPASSAEVPANRAEEPASSAEVPANRAEKPVDSPEAPADSVSEPVKSASEVVELVSEPVKSTSEAVKSASKAVEPVSEAVNSVSEAVTPASEPVKSEAEDEVLSEELGGTPGKDPVLDYSLWENAEHMPSYVAPVPPVGDGYETVEPPATPVLFADWSATPLSKTNMVDKSTITPDIEAKVKRQELSGYLQWYLTDSLEEQDVKRAIQMAKDISETTAVLKVQKLLKESSGPREPPTGWTLKDLEEATGANLLWQALEERLRSRVRVTPSKKPATKPMPKSSGAHLPKASGVHIPGVRPPPPKKAPAHPKGSASSPAQPKGSASSPAQPKGSASSGGSPAAPKTPPKGIWRPPPSQDSQDDSWGKWKPDDSSSERLKRARLMVEEAKEKCRALYIQRNPSKAPPAPPKPPAPPPPPAA